LNADTFIAEFELARGERLALYAGRLVHQGSDTVETVPLAHLASVRVAFERDARQLNGAIILLVVALILALSSGPLHGAVLSLAAGVKEHGGRESLEAVLLACFEMLAGLARLMAPLAAALAAIAVALLALFAFGRTTLTLAFAATERAWPVRGRNRPLMEFAERVGDQLAARRD
jgi:hypothetical protein